MITPKLRTNERLVIWALVLRFVVFAIPLVIFITVVFTRWTLNNCVIILDFISSSIESFTKKYARKLPASIATKRSSL